MSDVRKDILPCSVHQLRWLIAQEQYDLSRFNLHFLLKLEGRFDEQRFLDTVTNVLRGFDIARTAFAKIDGIYQRIVYQHSHFQVEKLSFPDKQALLDFCEQKAKTPFDFSYPPLVYSAYATVGSDSYWFFVIHHIVGDVSSGFILTQHIQQQYQGKATPPFHHYDEYIHNEEKRFKMLGTKALDYLSNQLTASEALCFSNHAMDAQHSQIYTLSFSQAQSEQLHQLSIDKRISLHTLFSLPLYLTHFHLRKVRKPLMAIPVSERRNAILKATPGFISGPMLVSMEMNEAATLDELINQGQKNFVNGLKFYLPIARYCQQFDCHYRVMFNVFDYRAWECEASDFHLVHQLMISPNTMQLEIFWVVFAYRDKIEMVIHYDQSCLSPPEIEHICQTYRNFFEALLNPANHRLTLAKLIKKMQ